MSRLFAVPILAVALVAGVAGCGSSDSSSTGSTATAAPAATTAAAGASAAATVGTADNGKLGTILVDGTGRTLYLWEADKGDTSACTGACAGGWPPLITKGDATASGSAKSDKLGTTKRPDGTTQVTYNGHPVYRFIKDTAPGQTNGQGSDGFGAEWYAMDPSGNKVDKDDGGDDSKDSSDSSTSSGGY